MFVSLFHTFMFWIGLGCEHERWWCLSMIMINYAIFWNYWIDADDCCWLNVCFYWIKLYMGCIMELWVIYIYIYIYAFGRVVCRYTQVSQSHMHKSGRASALERLVVQSGRTYVLEHLVVQSGEDLCPDECFNHSKQRWGLRPWIWYHMHICICWGV